MPINADKPHQWNADNVGALMVKRVLLSWSSGKDSAWALHVLRMRKNVEVVGLLTTFNDAAGRVAMHAVRRELVAAQAAAAGLPLWQVGLPSPCSNEAYEAIMRNVVAKACAAGITQFAFGGLFLEEVRAYRVRQLEGAGVEPIFPIWTTPDDTPALARQMLEAGLRATLTCVDPRVLDSALAGRSFDASLLDELPPSVDPCGERGEFHTFCCAGPMFRSEIRVVLGETVIRDGFCFADLKAEEGERPSTPHGAKAAL
jgi:uncharacterized protein (TIGR00290 family)